MKPKKKNVSFEFWKVSTPTAYASGFAGALNATSQITQLTARNKDINGYTMRWEEIDIGLRYIIGDFVKLRLDVLPLKGGVATKSIPLNLHSSEGISEPFVFLFDKQSDILVTQHNHYSASVSAFMEYIQQLVPIGGVIETFPVFSTAGLQKLNQMNDVRKVSYKIAKPTQPGFNPSAKGPVDSSISTMSDLGGESIEVLVTSGFSRRSLTIREILRKATDLLTGQTTGNASVEKFEVAGYINGRRDEFDLVKEQLRSKQLVAVGQNRSLGYFDRKDAVMKALNNRRSELIAQFGAICA
ncbi:hypothetical protein OpiT1DRAFT_02537 [Opitutaceae bacterium TAV1]|nr:hypothetical protein OpiT1DRAFT_02537 [Opitutaceae bacterium TAV1]